MKIHAPLVVRLSASLVICFVSCSSNAPRSQSNVSAGDSAAATNNGSVGGTASDSGDSIAAGSYRITGRNQNGSAYNGTLTITARGPVYHLAWQAGENYEGTGIAQGNSLAAGWGGSTCTVASYHAQPDGSLDGQWTTIGENQAQVIGTERAVRSSGAAGGDIAGAYTVTGRSPNGTQYRGGLTITRRGAVYQFSWNIGRAYEGVGIRQGNTIAVGWGAEKCGVANYQIGANGTLRGVWGVYGQNQSGTEEGVRQ